MQKITFSLLVLFTFFSAEIFSQTTCIYTLEASDAFEDGWDNGVLTITIAGDSQDYTLDSGAFDAIPLEVAEGDLISLEWSRNSDFPEEIKYELFDAEGNSLINIEDPSIDDEIAEFTVSCPACSIPAVVEVLNIAPDGGTFSWIPVNTVSEGYKVIIVSQGDNPETDALAEYFPSSSDSEISITGLENGTEYDLYIQADCGDEGLSNFSRKISFTTLDFCPVPQSFVSTFTGDTFIDFEWNTSVNASGYRLLVFNDGDNPNEGAPVVSENLNATDTKFRVSGLNSDSIYEAYLIAVCGSFIESELSPVVRLKTACQAFSAPYLQTFDVTATPECWGESGYENWQYDLEPDFGAQDAADHTTGNIDSNAFAWIDSSTNIEGNESTLITPLVDVSSLINPEVSFWVFSNNTEEPGLYNTLSVSVFDGESFQPVYIINRKTAGPDGWEQFVINLDEMGITGLVQVRFTNITSIPASSGSPFYNDILIDDVRFDETSCVDPKIQLEEVNITSVQLIWDDIEYDPDGYTWAVYEIGTSPSTDDPLYTGTTVSGETSVVVENLSPASGYTAYVRANCVNDFIYEGLDFVTQSFCEAPSGLNVLGTSTSSVLLNWNSIEGNGKYEYVLTFADDNPYDSDNIVVSGQIENTEIQVSELESNIAYKAYLRTICDPAENGLSLFSVGVQFQLSGACGMSFTDTGGRNGNYGNNEKYTVFFIPEQQYEKVTLDFTSVDIEESFDVLAVYNGIGTTGDILSTELKEPQSFTSTTIDGGLTVTFRSDISFNKSGWEANINCDLGIKEEKLTILEIWPNPVSNSLFIKSQNPINKVSIFNVRGQKIMEESNDSIKSIDLSILERGVYFIQLDGLGETQIKRILKQ